MQNDIADYLFDETSLLDEHGKIKMERLEEWNQERFTHGHRGKVVIGPLRIT